MTLRDMNHIMQWGSMEKELSKPIFSLKLGCTSAIKSQWIRNMYCPYFPNVVLFHFGKNIGTRGQN